jgi:hypothetical protein
MYWINLAQIGDQWWEIPGAAMQISAFQEELWSNNLAYYK